VLVVVVLVVVVPAAGADDDIESDEAGASAAKADAADSSRAGIAIFKILICFSLGLPVYPAQEDVRRYVVRVLSE